jgi:hypothetical protein
MEPEPADPAGGVLGLLAHQALQLLAQPGLEPRHHAHSAHCASVFSLPPTLGFVSDSNNQLLVYNKINVADPN